MKSVYTLLFTFLIYSLNSYSQQKEVSLYLSHYYSGENFDLDETYAFDDGINCDISRLEYYLNINTLISNTGNSITFEDEFYTAGDAVIYYTGKQILVNTQKNKYSLGVHDISDLNTMEFHIGVPSEINHQDPAIWANSHPLAPKSPSMHWGWASGYRFIALEAMVDEDSDGVFESVLQYHAVGDALYRVVNQTITTVETEDEIIIYLDVNYENLFTGIDASIGGVFHGDQNQVVGLMDNFATNNVFSNSENLSINKLVSINEISPNPFSNYLTIQLEETSKIKIHSILGTLVYQEVLVKGIVNINTHTFKAGVYIVEIESKNNMISYKLVKN